MAITKNINRQDVKVAYVDINLADVVSASDLSAISLPPNSVILAGEIVTTEAWNSTTSDVMDVGDAASQNRYLNDGNIRALGARVALVPTGFIHPGGDLTVRWTSGGGTPTTGKSRLTVQYMQLGRGDSTYD
jgi:Flp pilus assembly protein CpaB